MYQNKEDVIMMMTIRPWEVDDGRIR